MRSRITGRTLLPAVLAAAAVAAPAVPAAALAAPPPAPDAAAAPAGGAGPQDQSTDDCAKALQLLSSLELLPKRPDVGRTLCSVRAERQPQSAKGDVTDEVTSEHTAPNGRTVREDTVLGIPVEWPKSLTVHVPTVNDHWYTYSSKKG